MNLRVLFVLLVAASLFPRAARAADTQPPTTPTGVYAINVTTSDLVLDWTASTDNVGVTAYEVFRNGVSLGTTASATMSVGGLASDTLYQFTVRARDAVGNWSPLSAVAFARTWQRIYSASGFIGWHTDYDEDGNETGQSIDENYHYVSVPRAGTVKFYTGGYMDTYGYFNGVWGNDELPVWNFQVITNVGAGGSYAGWVSGYNNSSGNYDVYADFRSGSTPVANFTASVTSGRAPLAVSFDGSGSTNLLGYTTGYAWDFDDNGSIDATTVSASTTYNNATATAIDYTARLTLTDYSGTTGAMTRTIRVYPASSYAIAVQNGTTSLPFQVAGSTVTLTAGTPPLGQQFTGWTIVSGAGSFTNSGAPTTPFTLGAADTVVRANFQGDVTPPTAPGPPVIATTGSNFVTLSWAAATDNVAVTGYEIFRNGTSAGTVTGTSATITGLSPLTIYQLTVRARDAAGNWSAPSNGTLAKTWQLLVAVDGMLYTHTDYDPDTETSWTWCTTDSYAYSVSQPGTIRAYSAGSTDTQGSDGWASANSGGAGGNFQYTRQTTPGTYTLWVTGETPQTSGPYRAYVEFMPSSTPTASFTATPMVGRSPQSVMFDSSASIDPNGLATYAWDFDHDGITDSTAANPTHLFTNSTSGPVDCVTKLTLTDGFSGSANSATRTITIYPANTFAVAVENGVKSNGVPYVAPGTVMTLTANAAAAGKQFLNWSLVSGVGTFADANAGTTTFTVAGGDAVVWANYVDDTFPPSIPTHLTVSNVGTTSADFSWEASTDPSGVALYEIMANGVPVGTSTYFPSLTLSGLAAGGFYQFAVRARDTLGNWSAPSAPLRVKMWKQIYSATGSLVLVPTYDESGEQDGWTTSVDLHPFTATARGAVRIRVVTYNDIYAGFNGVTTYNYWPNGGLVYTVATSLEPGPYSISVGSQSLTPGEYTISVEMIETATASFTAAPLVGRSPLAVTFDSAASTLPSPTSARSWDLGNGTAGLTTVAASTTYTAGATTPATYVAKLTVADPTDGSTDTRQQSIVVYPTNSYTLAVQGKSPDYAGPYLLPGSNVELSTALPAGKQFDGWSIVSGNGTFADAANMFTTFTTGTADTVLKPNFSPDVTPPQVHGFLTPRIDAGEITVAWSPATDNVAVTGYEVFINDHSAGVSLATSHRFDALQPATEYHFKVRAVDAGGNWSAFDLQDNTTAADSFAVTVIGGSSTADYLAEGDVATIQVNSVPGFTGWSLIGAGASLASRSNSTTTLTMGNAPVTVSAHFGAAPQITSATAAANPLNTAFSYQIAVNGEFVLSYGASGLPSGLSLDPATGLISGVPTRMGSFAVTLTASNGAGTGTRTLNLSVTSAPIITVQPASLTVGLGGQATMTIAAVGMPAPDYQWRKNGVNVAGAIAASLPITNAQALDGGSYTVAVTNSVGSIVSSPATLTVGPQSSAPVLEAATALTSGGFTANWDEIAGADYRVDASASDSFSTFVLESAVVSGANHNHHQDVGGLAPNTVYYYRVRAVSGAVTSANSAVASITTLPAIVTQPQNASIVSGHAAVFSVEVPGTAATTYQWRKNGSIINGATSNTLTLANVQPADAGSYAVWVTNAGGSVTSSLATLTIAVEDTGNTTVKLNIHLPTP